MEVHPLVSIQLGTTLPTLWVSVQKPKCHWFLPNFPWLREKWVKWMKLDASMINQRGEIMAIQKDSLFMENTQTTSHPATTKIYFKPKAALLPWPNMKERYKHNQQIHAWLTRKESSKLSEFSFHAKNNITWPKVNPQAPSYTRQKVQVTCDQRSRDHEKMRQNFLCFPFSLTNSFPYSHNQLIKCYINGTCCCLSNLEVLSSVKNNNFTSIWDLNQSKSWVLLLPIS